MARRRATALFLGACAIGVAGFLLGRRAASGKPGFEAQAQGYEYRVVTLVDALTDGTTPAPHGDFATVRPVWRDVRGGAAAPSNGRPAQFGEIDLQVRVAATINRLGAEGWEFTTAGKDAWPDPVPATGVMFFRRPR